MEDEKNSSEAGKELAGGSTRNLAAPEAGDGVAGQPPHEDLARAIIKHISNAALELAFIRHDLTSDGFDAEDYPDIKGRVQAQEKWWEEIKEDALDCLTGDETGCADPEDLDATNCELIWLAGILGCDSHSEALALATKPDANTGASPGTTDQGSS